MMDPFFIYLLKGGGIILLFLAMYRLLLKHETFFAYNRYFLLGGMAAALLLPLLVFTKIVYISSPQVFSYGYGTNVTSNSLSSFNDIRWSGVFPLMYWAGVSIFSIRFIIQLLSLTRLIRSSTLTKSGRFKMVETRAAVTPFSFFNYIVYHPGTYTEKELHTIIEHEKIHARQWHSADILLAHLLTIFLWFIPFAWAYKQCITQNLEYIADNEAVRKVACRKNYQYLLLNASVKAYQPAITNNFFNSLIKKRIVMLNKNRSQQRNVWRYGVILPFLMVFLLVFNVKTVAQVKVVKEVQKDGGKDVEIVHYSIDKNTTDKELSRLKAEVKDEDGKFSYTNVERNDDGEITSISITFRDDEGRFANGNFSEDNGINPIYFGNNEKGGVFIWSGDHHDSEHHADTHAHAAHTIHADADSDHEVTITQKGGKGEKKKVKLKKTKHAYAYEVEKEVDDEKVIIIENDGKGKNRKVHKIKVGKGDHGNVMISGDDMDGDPLVFIDGKKSSKEQIEDLDEDTIERVEVLKGEGAVEKYGKKAKNGVILITTKDED